MNKRISPLRSLILITVIMASQIILDIARGLEIDWKTAIFYGILFGVVDLAVSVIRSRFEKW